MLLIKNMFFIFFLSIRLSKVESESGLKLEILDAIDKNVIPMLRLFFFLVL